MRSHRHENLILHTRTRAQASMNAQIHMHVYNRVLHSLLAHAFERAHAPWLYLHLHAGTPVLNVRVRLHVCVHCEPWHMSAFWNSLARFLQAKCLSQGHSRLVSAPSQDFVAMSILTRCLYVCYWRLFVSLQATCTVRCHARLVTALSHNILWEINSSAIIRPVCLVATVLLTHSCNGERLLLCSGLSVSAWIMPSALLRSFVRRVHSFAVYE